MILSSLQKVWRMLKYKCIVVLSSLFYHISLLVALASGRSFTIKIYRHDFEFWLLQVT
jgi:hypothetical protein